MTEVNKSFSAKLIAIIASIALAMSMFVFVQPAQADTNFTNTVSTTSVQVKITDSGTVQTVNFSSAATSATTHNAQIQSGTIGAMFYKEGYQIIGANSYVTLQDVITAAGGNSWSYVKFYVYNSKDNTYATYTKYNSGVFNRTATSSYAGVSQSLPFYGETDANGLDMTDPSYYYTSGAVLALNGASGTVSGTATAVDVLGGMSTFTTGTAPRLMWGYDTASEAGNRFPSNIVGITVYE